MVEIAIKADTAEAHRLYQRGVAAARGGQRRVAAGLLTRSVQLDPRNESAWLWLSGVLDDPHHVAFCLRSVLKLNPSNERALQGLRWLETQQLLKGAPSPAPVLAVQVDEPEMQRAERTRAESWWVNWRQSRREMSRVRLLLWSVPLVLLCMALVLHQTFALAVEESMPKPMPVAMVAPAAAEPVEPAVAATATPVPILEAEPASVREGLAIGYLNAMDGQRQQLRNAVDSYLNATGRPGGASVGHVTAAQTLRASVAQAHAALQKFMPPQDLQAAHAAYLHGLELEMLALDDLMEFYGSYKPELANRAALRFQQAGQLIEQANIAFAVHREQMTTTSSISAHSIR